MQKYHVDGRYIALYKDGRQSGEISYSRELTTDSPGKAIIQVAIEATLDFDYQAITG